MLTPIKFLRIQHGAIWLCRCDCGTEKEIGLFNLSNGNIVSCGCHRRRKASERLFKHGRSGTPTYKCWRNMLNRCNDPKHPKYHRYGGRGIKVCKEWSESIDKFIEDM